VIASTPMLSAIESELYQYQIVATDVDSSDLSFNLLNSPDGMSIDSNTGLVSWVPDYYAAAEYPITVSVTDGILQDTQSFSLNVQNTNRAPVINTMSLNDGLENTPYSYSLDAVDPDNNQLTYTLQSAPLGMSINSSGLIQWVPSYDEAGIHSVTI
ncbi:putative Ig domain-containing protein, partial [Oleiphilus sp. HI0123]